MHKTFTRRAAFAVIGDAVSSIALPLWAKQFETNGVATLHCYSLNTFIASASHVVKIEHFPRQAH